MIFKLPTEHYLEFLAAEARPSLHMSKCHIVGNLMHWLIYISEETAILKTSESEIHADIKPCNLPQT